MLLFYFFLTLMCISAMSLLAVAFRKNQQLISKHFLWLIGLMLLFSLSLYFFTHNHRALKEWLTKGHQHYQLQQEVAQMGGVSGMIVHVKNKLAKNPNDATGWFILGKLYLANQEEAKAQAAFDKAKQLHSRP